VQNDSLTNAFTYGDNVSWQLGRHTLKFGVTAIRYQSNRNYSGNDGVLGHFDYNGNYSGDAKYNTGSDTATLTVNGAAPSVTLSANPTSVQKGQASTITATVAGSQGTPTGSVSVSGAGGSCSSPVSLLRGTRMA